MSPGARPRVPTRDGGDAQVDRAAGQRALGARAARAELPHVGAGRGREVHAATRGAVPAEAAQVVRAGGQGEAEEPAAAGARVPAPPERASARADAEAPAEVEEGAVAVRVVGRAAVATAAPRHGAEGLGQGYGARRVCRGT